MTTIRNLFWPAACLILSAALLLVAAGFHWIATGGCVMSSVITIALATSMLLIAWFGGVGGL